MKTRELPRFVHHLLASPPRAGEGVHNWLFIVARQLHAHLPAVEIVNLLERRLQGCGRHVSRKEIEDAVRNSISCAWQPRGASAPVPAVTKWPAVNQEQLEAIMRAHGGLADLWELSLAALLRQFSTIPPEVQPAPIVRELLLIEPDLARLIPAGELEIHLRFFARLLRLGAELEKRGAE